MSITSMNGLVSALGTSTKCRFYKPSISSQAAGNLVSMWKSAGIPVAGAIPSTSAYCDDTTSGSWTLPTANDTLYLGKCSAALGTAGTCILFDRLSHMGGLNGTLTTAQTVNLDIVTPASQGRCAANGSDVLWALEWYTATGSTAVTATVSYTNQSDVSGETVAISLAATRPASLVLPIIPTNGDTSIKSIQSVTLSATTGTAGSFGVTARKRHAEVPLIVANVGAVLDYAGLCLEQVMDTSCLEWVVLVSTTSTGVLLGSFEVLNG